MSEKLVITSLRLPVAVTKKQGKLQFKASSGGLATGVSTVSKKRDSIWIGWPGISTDELTAKEQAQIKETLQKDYNCYPVFLTQKQVDNYYAGYCNDTLWPLFHYFLNKAQFSDDYWVAYKTVNKLFAKVVGKFIDSNARVWVHDYQLMLLPKLLREKRNTASIGFFLHTPFPSYEVFRLLPQREEILKGLLGADLVGFHTYDYVRHFLSSVHRTLGLTDTIGAINYKERTVLTDAFPISIDYKKFAKTPKRIGVKKLARSFQIFKENEKVILSVDRSDYSKGIPERLKAYSLFLEQNPEYHGKVVLMVLAVPSRGSVEAYQKLRQEIEQTVSHINGQYSTVDWTPIHYRHQSLGFSELCALYARSDVMLVTPLRDGMNLVSKEYVATHHNSGGVLVLSEVAGSATELTEALQINPHNTQQLANTIKQALEMPKKEQVSRMKAMQERISNYDIIHWAEDFIHQLDKSRDKYDSSAKKMTQTEEKNMKGQYMDASRRLILLDYDGTLRSFVTSPKTTFARPSARVKRLIKKLTNDPKNRVVIISGRAKTTLETYFENIGLGLVAEHGGWVFDTGRWIKGVVVPKKWKKPVRHEFERYVSRTPGAELEEKELSMVWHYRNVSPDLAYVRKEELKMDLNSLLNPDFNYMGVFEGEKMIEVKPRKMHKGAIVSELLTQGKWDFILAIGDDYTDEDMFKALPEKAYTIHVGSQVTAAKYQVRAVKEVLSLLEGFNAKK